MRKVGVLYSAASAIVAAFLTVNAAAADRASPARLRQPSPPPPPTATSFPLKSSASFNTGIGFREASTDPQTGNLTISQTGVTGQGNQVTISYDASRGIYTMRNGAITASFVGASRSVSGPFDVYSKQGTRTFDQLSLFDNVRVATSTPVKLTYVSFGYWSHTDRTTGDRNDIYFLYGFPTTDAGMPRTGTASYGTMVAGNSVRTGAGAGSYQLAGNATFDADFANGTVNTQLNLTRTIPGGTWDIGSFTGNGTIYSSQFSGSFTSSVSSFAGGSFAGGFYGPGAAEMGYNFGITLLQSDPYACAALPCAYQESIIGTVVGAKQ
jgi:hypothetical protein